MPVNNVIPIRKPTRDHHGDMLARAVAIDPYWTQDRDEALEWELRIALSEPEFLAELEVNRRG